MAEPAQQAVDRRQEFKVLTLIVGGLISILMTIVLGLFVTSRPGYSLPNWAENVLVAIATACVLKLGDCIGALTQLASGRQISRMGEQLGQSTPAGSNAVGDMEVTADHVDVSAPATRRTGKGPK